MLMPDDWRSYRWDVFYSTGAGSTSDWIRRLWRITATTGATPAAISFGPYGSVSVPANSTVVLEPRGMFPLDITWGPFQLLVVETIGKDAG